MNFILNINIFSFLFLSSTIAAFVLFLVIFKIKNNPSANWLKILVLISAFHSFTQFLISVATNSQNYELLQKINSLSLLLIAPAFLNFAFAYIGEEKTIKHFNFVIFNTSLFLVFLFIWWNTGLFVIPGYNNAVPTAWGPSNPIGPFQSILVGYFLLNYLYGTFLLIKNHQVQVDSAYKKQSFFIILACCLPFALDLLIEGFFPMLGFKQFPGTAIFTNIMCGLVAYAIYKYGLFYVDRGLLAESLIKNLPLLFFVTDQQGSIIGTNDAVAQFGLTKKEVIGQPVTNFIEAGEDLKTYLKQKNTGKFNKETTFLRRNKPILPIQITASDLIENSAKAGTLIMVSDLSFIKYSVKSLEKDFETIQKQNVEMQKSKQVMVELMKDLEAEKKKVEEKVKDRTKELKDKAQMLESQNLLFESFVSNLPIGAILVDVNSNKISLINALAIEIFEINPDILRSKNKYYEIVKLYREDGSELAAEEWPITRAIKNKTLVSEQLFFKHKNGKLQPLRIHSAPVKNQNGVISSAVQLIEDVTKEYAVDKSKSEFVSLASHQLRTPLSSINWYAEMLESGDAGKLNKEQKDFINEIILGARRMADLVTTLLNVSRIDMGTFVINPEPRNIYELISNEINQLKLQFESKGINLKFSSGTKKSILCIDEKVLSIIMQNLLTNAIKYTPVKGKISIEIKTNKKAGDFIIVVSDNGYGIPKDQQDKIFGKLFRADNVKSMEIDGNGLGLYMVKSIAENSGCKIWFESVENKGTSFYLSIPSSGMKKINR